jgi:hypothetical protein
MRTFAHSDHHWSGVIARAHHQRSADHFIARRAKLIRATDQIGELESAVAIALCRARWQRIDPDVGARDAMTVGVDNATRELR